MTIQFPVCVWGVSWKPTYRCRPDRSLSERSRRLTKWSVMRKSGFHRLAGRLCQVMPGSRCMSSQDSRSGPATAMRPGIGSRRHISFARYCAPSTGGNGLPRSWMAQSRNGGATCSAPDFALPQSTKLTTSHAEALSLGCQGARFVLLNGRGREALRPWLKF